eukprot:GSMAST32.ASY1.ANO1.2524.1 assembled CDS
MTESAKKIDIPSRKSRASIKLQKPATEICPRENIYCASDEVNESSTSTGEKSSKTKEIILETLRKHVLFRAIELYQLRSMIDAMFKRDINKGDVLIQKDETHNEEFFMLESGEVNIRVGDDGDDERVIGAPFAFGETGLINAKLPRTASVICSLPGTVWVMTRSIFRSLMHQCASSRQVEILGFLKQVTLLSSLSHLQLIALTDVMVEKKFKQGTKIITEGDAGDSFYIVFDGVCSVAQDSTLDKHTFSTVPVATLRKGDHFGEMALLSKDNKISKRMATEQNRAKQAAHIEAHNEKLVKLKKELINACDIRISLKDYKCEGQLGAGTYGNVYLATHKATGNYVAVKAIHKSHLLDTNQEENITRERDALICFKGSTFIMDLLGTWQDEKTLYFITEYIAGGDMWHLITSLGGLQSSMARVYVTILTSALKRVHEAGFAHRDIKLENILLCKDGYIKLVDFGFAKRIKPGTKTSTLVGTPEYLAPEIILATGHNKAVDYWALGIIAYELIHHQTPFVSEDQMTMFSRIVHCNKTLSFHPNVEGKATHGFVTALLNKNPALRLGMMSGGFDDLRMHEYFDGIIWQKVESKKYNLPFNKPPAFTKSSVRMTQSMGSEYNPMITGEFTREETMAVDIKNPEFVGF